LVLAGLPTTRIFALRLATSSSASSLPGKDGAVGFEQVLALHALRTRSRPDQKGHVDIAKRNFGSDAAVMPASSANAQSSSSIITPLSAACAFSSGISSICRMTG
jgi:hypothetical protein